MFIGVNSNDNAATREEFLKEEPVPFQALRGPEARDRRGVQRGPGLPEHGVLRPKGELAYVHQGGILERGASWRRTSSATLADPVEVREALRRRSWPPRSRCASGCSAASRACPSRRTRTAATPRRHTSWPSTTGVVIGTCRLLFRGHVARLGRLAVERDQRGAASRAAILREADRSRAERRDSIALHAQTYAGPLRAGRLRGARRAFVEEGIEHVAMEKRACLSCASTRSPGCG